MITALDDKLEDAKAMIDLAVEADDATLLADVQAELDEAEAKVADLEFKRMFSGEMDGNNCYVDISQAQAVPKHKTGQRCCCGCICAGVNHMALKPKSWNYQQVVSQGLKAHRFM